MARHRTFDTMPIPETATQGIVILPG